MEYIKYTSKSRRTRVVPAEEACKQSWYDMKRRCNDTKYHAYHRYGGLGITYDPVWETYEMFLFDMGLPPFDVSAGRNRTLDRIDNKKNYSRNNCRWATKEQQAWNKSISITTKLQFES